VDRARNVLYRLRGSLWFLPALMSAAAMGGAYALLVLGVDFSARADADLWWLFSGDAGTARDLLSTLLSGMITMTSLVVSITVVVLALAAGQLGPRLVWIFVRDRQIQAVLGLFLATILYNLVVLRSLDVQQRPDEVPHLAVTAGSALVVVCLFALLFYLHKISRSIISDTVVHRVARELEQAVSRLAPDGAVDEPEPAALVGDDRIASWVALDRGGYVQVIDHDALVRLGREANVRLRVAVRPGEFVLRAGRHVGVLPARELREDEVRAIRAAFVIGPERSPAQDLAYSIRHLVEIALRALSPGINDPFTAIAALDHLAAALEVVFHRSPGQAIHRDRDGVVRVVAAVDDARGVLGTALGQIREAGQANAAILAEIAELLGKLAPSARTGARRDAVLEHLAMVERAARRHLPEPADVAAVERRVAASRARVGTEGGAGAL
jgi:uncharacterized membrane protein